MISRARAVGLAAVCAIALGALPAAPAFAIDSLPTSFVADNAVPGHTFSAPTGMAFFPDGRYLVAEKRGRVWLVNNGVVQSTPVLAIESEVLDDNDRGMLDVAVDPNFATNRYVYFLYTVDPDNDGNDANNVVAFGRLTRYTLNASNVADPATRTVLLGATWPDGPPVGSTTHSIGSLRWGEDGSLLVSCGEGAEFNGTDPGGLYSALFQSGRTDPYEDIGAFRAQSLSSLGGKILRINPANGSGYSNNPYWDGNAFSKRSRIWCYGLRNPFRFTVRPGTGNASTSAGDPGTLYIGDVGWTTWEEMDVAASGGKNFGWPCYEGRYSNSAYQSLTPAHNGCNSIGTSDNPTSTTLPPINWNHDTASQSTPSGTKGNCVIGGSFYTGTLYPTAYRNRLFFGDYGQNWIQVANFDASENFVSLSSFALNADGPVCFRADPISGDIFYVAITTGEVRRIRYTAASGNAAPIAVAAANPLVGFLPLDVTFSSAGTQDPDNDPISYSWSFGDGQGSNSANPTHTYTTAGAFDAILTVSDTKGGVGRDTVTVSVTQQGSFPSTGVLDAFNRTDGTPLGSPWTGTASGLQTLGGQLAQPGGGWASTVYNGATFGTTQEGYVTLSAMTGGATEHDLMLKVQGTTWDAGHIEVRYDVDPKTILVHTYDPGQGWVRRGGPYNVALVAGDRLGARAYPDGTLEIYKNALLVASTTVAGWPSYNKGGRLGLTIVDATQSRFDNFGGGNAILNSNVKPHATILAPAAGSFYTLGGTISLSGTATDDKDAVSALQFRWEIDLHHNNHVHPQIHSFTGQTASYLGENHDDGTGVYETVRLIATDTGGLSDTTSLDIYPQIDLSPLSLAVSPGSLTDTTPVTVSFTLRNTGGMPAPISRWQLRLDGASLAVGDTIVPINSSVTISRNFAPFSGGPHVLRATADTLAQVVETSETNNGTALSLSVAGAPPPPPGNFPSTAVLDNFNRANGALGGSWVGETSGLGVNANRMVQNTAAWNTVIWNGGTFGANQEAYVTLAAITAGSPEHDVLLKVQGTSTSSAQLEVRYDDATKQVKVSTLDGTTWTRQANITQTLVAGDVLGARALSTGSVEVYRNGVKIATVSIASWPYAASGGRLGMTVANATSSALDNFGGGNVATGPDLTPPAFTSGPTATPGATTAVVAWSTNEAATGAVRYGKTTALGDSVTATSATSQSKTLTGLTRGTLYYYRVAATDAAGNTAVSAQSTFTTAANTAPIAAASGTPTSGPVPLTVQFSSAGSSDPDGDPLSFAWNFGDGQTGSGAAPSHLYATAGGYTAQLTVSDGLGGSASATVGISAGASGTPFPATAVLDNFNRANGALGGSWVGETSGLGVNANRMVQNTAAWNTVIWNGGIWGVDQEAYVTIAALTANSPEHDVLLKVQGTTTTSAQLEVRYDDAAKLVKVSTLSGTTWTRQANLPATLVAGDQLGARAFGGGVVEVYKNGVKIGTASIASWPYAGSGGRLGITIANATSSALDNYGGGTLPAGTVPSALLANAGDPLATGLADTDREQAIDAALPARLGLSAAVPNPTRGSVSWTLALPRAGRVEWQIVDLQGRSVWRETLERTAGRSTLGWRATGRTPPGLYLAVVRAGGESVTRRFVLIP